MKNISELMILEQFLRMVNPDLEVWIRERIRKSAEESALLAEVFMSARTGTRRITFGLDSFFAEKVHEPARTVLVLVNGQHEVALLDTTCFQSMVLSRLVPRE